MADIKEIIEQQTEILKDAKSREEIEQCWKNLRAMATKYNLDNEKPTCQGCLVLDKIHRWTWILSKTETYTANYECSKCRMVWLFTYYKN